MRKINWAINPTEVAERLKKHKMDKENPQLYELIKGLEKYDYVDFPVFANEIINALNDKDSLHGLRIIFNLYGLERYSDIFVAYISPTNTVLALLFFIICLKIKVRSESITKILTLLSTTTLGIFLIHAHPLVRSNLTNKLVFLTQYNPIVTCILIIAFGLAVFIVCAIIDYLRSKLFEITKINALTKRIDNKIKFN